MTSANWITLLRFAIALTGAFLVGDEKNSGWIRIATALFVIALILDKLDGVVARRFNCCTSFGKFFDTAVDKIILAVFFLCLLGLGIIDKNLVIAALVRDMLTQAFHSYAESQNILLKTHNVSYIRHLLQCLSVISGLLSVVLGETQQAGLFRQLSLFSFIAGLALGYLILLNIISRHWREVLRSGKYHP